MNLVFTNMNLQQILTALLSEMMVMAIFPLLKMRLKMSFYVMIVTNVLTTENVFMNDETKLFNLKQMRNQYFSFRCYPRPKTSPYDEEIKELEKKLKVKK